ncbi:Gfo/Idh/MocA family protein [Nakamurella sp.]|uniref:Gfo/Idh/MocA family protein n=1 Tax=Nakamurella sp. TaxID=1869182 RepID=UPI003784AF3C
MTPAFPTARTPNPLDAPPLRWGVLAPGRIAAAFVTAVSRYTRQRVVAVGSRSLDRAQSFAAAHGIERAVGSYAALVDDPAVDVVYIASPHSEHATQAQLAISAGKPVLVEKAFARNAAEAQRVAAAARDAGVPAMEAMWTRFLPQTDVIAQLLADGALGEVTTVLADHGQYFTHDPQSRLFAPALAGGALLDLGVYPISFASFVLGAPDAVVATGSLTDAGVDAQVSMTLVTGSAQACLNTTLLARTPTTASISGTTGSLEISGPFYAPATLALTTADGRSVRPPDPIAGHLGLCHEAAHLAQLIADGATESPLLPLDETVRTLRTIDEIRRQVGVTYPGE